MAVPETVDSVREQIKEATKLVLSANGVTVLNINDPWSKYTAETDYPVCKAYCGNSAMSAQTFGSRDILNDEMFVQVAPFCKESDYEIACSKVIEEFRAYFNTETIRAQMDTAYQTKLNKVVPFSAELVNTNTACSYAVVQFKLTINYTLPSI